MRVACAIPARLESKRFPRKVLAPVGGEPLICRVWRRLSQIAWLDDLCVVTDSTEVRAAVEGVGGRVLMSSSECASGTERIWSVLDQLPCDVVLNVQADQPFVSEAVLSALLGAVQEPAVDVATPVYRITQAEVLFDPGRVKVVCGGDCRALYFSRSPIPHLRDAPPERWTTLHDYWGHMGVYAFRRDVLKGYGRLPPTELEAIEKLEQLRWLAGGWTITTVRADGSTIEIDRAEDLLIARHLLYSVEADSEEPRFARSCEV